MAFTWPHPVLPGCRSKKVLVKWWCSFLLKLLKSSHQKINLKSSNLFTPKKSNHFRNKTPIIFALRIWENLAFWVPILPCTSWKFFLKIWFRSVQYLRNTKRICVFGTFLSLFLNGVELVDSYERLYLRMILILTGNYQRMMESLMNCFSFPPCFNSVCLIVLWLSQDTHFPSRTFQHFKNMSVLIDCSRNGRGVWCINHRKDS